MAIASNFPSIKPSLLLDFANVGRLDPRITFTRASTGTYYDGVTTAKAEQNLLLQSQDFATSWSASNITVSANSVAAPDGTTTADTLNDGAVASASHSLIQTPGISASTTYAISVFAQNVDRRYFGLAISTTSSNNYGTVEFDLDGSGAVSRSSAVGTGFSVVSSSITSVGNSWFRCVAIITTGSASVTDGRATIYLSDGAGAFDSRGRATYSGTNASIYAWGAQLEQRSAVTAYTATTTQPITNYIPVLLTAQANVARFDHNPTTGEALGLLIEEARTNIVLNSGDFSNASFAKGNVTVTGSSITAPDGTTTGTLFDDDTAAGTHSCATAQQTLVSGTTYTLSVFAKNGDRNFITLAVSAGTNTWAAAKFDLSNGTVGSTSQSGSGWSATSGSITNVGGGWFRCSLTYVPGSTGVTLRFGLATDGTTYTAGERGLESYTGSDKTVYLWGGQHEIGAFITSYIPTTTTALTRNADVASMTGTNFSSWYSASEGTVYADFQWTTTSARNNSPLFRFDDGTNNNFLQLGFRNVSPTAPGSISLRSSGGTIYETTTGTVNTNDGLPHKFAGAYTASELAFSADGQAAGTATPAGVPTVTTARFGASNVGVSSNYAIYIRRIAYYPTRLPDTTLQALTA